MNSKLKIALVFALFGIFQWSFAQDYKSSTESVKSIDSQLENASVDQDNVTTDKLILKVKEDSTLDANNSSKKRDLNPEEKDWLEIKKEIDLNKKKVSANKNYIHTKKVIDTVFIDVPSFGGETQLSGW